MYGVTRQLNSYPIERPGTPLPWPWWFPARYSRSCRPGPPTVLLSIGLRAFASLLACSGTASAHSTGSPDGSREHRVMQRGRVGAIVRVIVLVKGAVVPGVGGEIRAH